MKQTQKTSARGYFYMALPVILLGLSLLGWIFMVNVALDDPGFAVEKDYYKKASEYDLELAQAKANERLGYAITVEKFIQLPSGGATLELRLRDRAGKPVENARPSAVMFANARASDLFDVTFEETSPGTYQTALSRARTGIWEVRLALDVDGQHFTQRLRPELSEKQKT